MRKSILVLTISWIYLTSAEAQSIERSVVASAGGVSVTSGSQITWTVGENVIQTAASGSVILTQGYQQPEQTAVSVKNLANPGNLRIYPNPSTGVFSLEKTGSQGVQGVFSIQVTDGAGKAVYNQNLEMSGNQKLDLSSLPGGVYLLQVNEAGKGISNFKITIIK